ncbi:purine-cytosine permease family protein [Paeniglutamicibacter sp. R2-26]|uniref:purine-cytosine permease family protein n=1 Tax=Paeniglutamicibacter sp. R2-26 TaxID=3144417 RepID=UPI003EE4C265
MKIQPGPAEQREPTRRTLVEQRTIEYIPLDERRGKPWHVTPVWFTSTSGLTSLAIGTIGVLNGLSLLWAILAIILGSAFGTVFSAFHASQGPQMGMPQLIQSRPQYGYRGAILIYLLSVFAYMGFSVFTILMLGQGFELLLGWPVSIGMVVACAIAVTVAAIGYDIVHKLARWFAWAFLICFLVVTIFIPRTLPEIKLEGGFSWSIFLLQAAACAAANLAWAPYVSDYTRYLPHMSLKSSFFSTYVGMTVAAVWIESVAAAVIAAFPSDDIVGALLKGGNTVFPGFGSVMLLLCMVGSLYLVAMNSYGGSLAILSIADSFKPTRATPVLRAAIAIALGAIALLIAFLASDQVLENYGTFLTILLYLLAPWTATNLVDFFLVRHGRYSIRDIFNPDGMYGAWNWRGYASYVVALVAMVPFVSTVWWTGPVATAWGFDVAPYVGILAAGISYWLFSRSIDIDAEQKLIQQIDAGLAKVNN